jgi:hypothetical protein
MLLLSFAHLFADDPEPFFLCPVLPSPTPTPPHREEKKEDSKYFFSHFFHQKAFSCKGLWTPVKKKEVGGGEIGWEREGALCTHWVKAPSAYLGPLLGGIHLQGVTGKI